MATSPDKLHASTVLDRLKKGIQAAANMQKAVSDAAQKQQAAPPAPEKKV